MVAYALPQPLELPLPVGSLGGAEWWPMAADGTAAGAMASIGVSISSWGRAPIRRIDAPRSLAEEDFNRVKKGFERCWSSGDPKERGDVAKPLLLGQFGLGRPGFRSR